MAIFKPVTKTPFWVFFLFFFFVFLVKPSFEENDSSTKTHPDTNIGNINIATTNIPSPSPPPPYEEQELDTSPFKPSVAVIIGVLTTMFSITFLLLLYAKHCKNGNLVIYSTNHAGGVPPPSSSSARKNSGIDRTVIEALPLFRFGSLSGQKDGLECAVCLTRFDPTEVLRLLPKCKHAFHVECVDTWLDSHSTCPLCRNRVNPEDILLIQQDVNIFHPAESQQLSPQREDLDLDKESPVKNLTGSDPAELDPGFRRVLGRHSSAGVTGTGNGEELSCLHDTTSSRRSLDSVRFTKSESVAVGCFDRPRKDGLLLTDGLMEDRKKSFERRFEHRIIISGGFHQRWSDVQPSDPLYLRSDMIISDSHRISLGSSVTRKQQRHSHSNVNEIGSSGGGGGGGGGGSSGNSVINTRSVSEITGLSRFSSRESNGGINRNRNRQRQAGLVSRWLAWMSTQSQSQTAVRSDLNTHISTFV